jgi:hypothetical protein
MLNGVDANRAVIIWDIVPAYIYIYICVCGVCVCVCVCVMGGYRLKKNAKIVYNIKSRFNYSIQRPH